MNCTHKISHRLVACVLLLGLALQSCTSSSNSVIPKVKEETTKEPVQERTQQIAFEELAEKELIAAGGHVVTFHEEAGQLRAEVAMHAPAGFSIEPYTNLEVKIASDIDVKQLLNLPSKIQQRYIHFQPAESGQSSRVLVHKGGLQGGMKRKRADQAKDKEKEIKEVKEKGEETGKSSEHTEDSRESKRQHILADENAVDEEVPVLEHFQSMPPELLLIILNYIPFPYIVDCMGINHFFYSFITGYEQVGQKGVEHKPSSTVCSLTSWQNERTTDCKACTTTPSWYLYCFMRKARNLASSFWPFLPVSQVHTLNLCCSGLGDKELVKLGENLNGSKVETVVLQTNQITTKGAAEFFKLTKTSQLRTVDLTANKIDAEGIEDLAKSLQGNQLQSINLSSNKIRVEGAIKFLKNLRGTEVKKANLARNKLVLDAIEAAEMAQSLQETNIENITLGNNNIELEAAIAFLSNLKETRVSTVNLGYNFLEGLDAHELAKSLQETQLRSIYLNRNLSNNFNGEADSWVNKFSKNLQGSKLIKIDLTQNRLTPRGLVKLFKNLKGTLIETVYFNNNFRDR